MAEKYDCIIFDLGNVILGFDYNISVGKLANKCKATPEKVYNLFFDSELTKLHDKGGISSLEFYSEVKDEIGLDMNFKEFADIWNDIFFEKEEVSDIIKLVKKNHRALLLSNTNKLHFDYIKKRFDIVNIFDDLVLSYEVGALKPEPPIYKLAIEKARTSPQRIFYTDDRPELVEGAKRCGIDAYLFRSPAQLKDFLKEKNII